jgi:DNA-binding phage protein
MVDFLEREDLVTLLREGVDKAGGQVAWSKKTGVNRSNLNRVLKGHRPPPETILVALKLRLVYVKNIQSMPFGHRPHKRTRTRKS